MIEMSSGRLRTRNVPRIFGMSTLGRQTSLSLTQTPTASTMQFSETMSSRLLTHEQLTRMEHPSSVRRMLRNPLWSMLMFLTVPRILKTLPWQSDGSIPEPELSSEEAAKLFDYLLSSDYHSMFEKIDNPSELYINQPDYIVDSNGEIIFVDEDGVLLSEEPEEEKC